MTVVNEHKLEESLLNTAEFTDQFEGYTHNHAFRIALVCENVGVKFNLSAHDLFSLRCAAFLHDVGEVLMMRDYIKAERKLDEKERIDMQRHTVIGEQETAKRGFSRAVQLLVRWHHEWWNGTGYPDALSGMQIPLAARILRVVDSYCALTDDRPYRAAISSNEARQYLADWAGIQFDPQVVKAFLELENLAELQSFTTNE